MLRRWLTWTIAPAVLACIVAAALPMAEMRLADLIFLMRGPCQPQAPVVLVSETSVSTSHWSHPLVELAKVVSRVSEGQPKAIVISLTSLVGMPEDEPGISELAQAMRKAGNVVIPACLVPAGQAIRSKQSTGFECGRGDLLVPAALRNGQIALPPLELFNEAAGVGTTNLYPDIDGVVRTFPLMVSAGGQLMPSLPLEAIRVAEGEPVGSARLEGGLLRVGRFAIPVVPDSAEMYLCVGPPADEKFKRTFSQILDCSAEELRSMVEGKIVVIGWEIAGNTSVFAVRGGPPTTGPHIVAAAIATILAKSWIRVPPVYMNWLLALAIALIAGLIAQRLTPTAGLVSNLALLVTIFAVVVLMAARGLQLPVLTLSLTIIFVTVCNVAAVAVAAERDRIAAMAAFNSRLKALDRIGELIGSAMDRDELLHAMMRWITREMNVEAASLLLVDKEHQQLQFEIALGPKGRQVQDFTVPLGHGIAGVVAQSGQSLIVNDAWRDPRHAQEISSAIDFKPRNILCVPMRLHGEVIGVIEVMNKRDGGEFTQQDEYLLTTIAAQAALLLENAQLISELQRRVDFANAELREAYRQLESEKAKVETLIDQMASPVVATDAENNIVLFNDAAGRALGISPEEAIGKNAIVVIPVPEIAALFAADLDSEGGQIVDELEIQREDGPPVTYRVSIALVRGPDGELMGKSLVMTDITELRELDRMKTDLISFVAHELNNPLGTIVGWAQLCLRRLRGKVPEEAMEPLRVIERQVRRTEKLVQDFLNLSRLEAGRPLEFEIEPITDLEALVRQVIELEPQRGRPHEFVIDIPPDLPPIYADRNKLEAIMTNLISNAMKYSPGGSQIRISAEEDGEWVKISVSDQGVGIPPEHQKNLFKKFHRVRGEASDRVPGTGIGLYLCRQFVEGHGGKIWVESEPGKGTTVYFTMPTRPPAGGGGEHEKQ